jgi:hypothetical protein
VKRDITVKVNLNRSEYDQLAAAAAARGLNLGAAIRESIQHIHQLPPQGLELNECPSLLP